jgi:membrane protease YdiL (CAAX protease family)
MEEQTLPPPAGTPPPAGGPPWSPGDMAKAIGLVIGGTLALSVPTVVIAAAIAGGSDFEDDPAALSLVLGSSLFLEVFLLVSAVLFSVRKYGVPWSALGLRWPQRGGPFLPLGLVLIGLAIVYTYFLALSAFGVKPNADIPEEAFHNVGPLAVLAVLSLVFAPIMEEIFFRGFIFGGLRGRWGTLPAALAAGFLFGLAHLGNPGTIYVFVPIGLVGAVFALGYAYSGSLLSAMVAHFLFNLVSFSIGLATS